MSKTPKRMKKLSAIGKAEKSKWRIGFKKWMQSDSFLRVLSVVCAFFVWFLVYTTIDTTTTTTIRDIPVEIDLSGTIAESNGLDVVDSEQRYVDVKIEGKSYEIGQLTADNFRATLSVTDVTKAGVYTALPINVERVDTNFSFIIRSITPSTMSVEFDSMETKTFDLSVSIPNVEAASGYLIDSYSVTPSTITITGPESIVDTIDHCVVENQDSKVLSESATLSGTVHLYDKSDHEIISDYLSYENTDYTISVPLYQKQTLPLSYDFVNVPEGIDTGKLDFTVDPASITVAIPVGASSNVSKISLGEIDFRKLDLNKTFTFDIPLLAGYLNLDEVKSATVTFDSEGYEKTYLSSSNIVLKNIPSGYSAELLTTTVSDICMLGKSEVLDGLSSSDLVLTVDLSSVNITVGEQRVPVLVTTTDKQQAWAIGEKSVLIQVTKDSNG